ncbi:protein O-mannosyl-transferase TMTC3-like [Brevipalpus obovatus]|uniref:protein O-mannosyl-transferase TMTC3-like n=1 Tax=Brevipalpus obovatus TaxID=246614 RepID=UPI003D9F957B
MIRKKGGHSESTNGHSKCIRPNRIATSSVNTDSVNMPIINNTSDSHSASFTSTSSPSISSCKRRSSSSSSSTSTASVSRTTSSGSSSPSPSPSPSLSISSSSFDKAHPASSSLFACLTSLSLAIVALPKHPRANLMATLLIAGLAFIVYSPSLHNSFVFDDMPTIVNNKDVHSTRNSVWNIFLNDYWGTPIHKEESHKSYRPLTILTFRWNYYIHQLDEYGYHLVNNILHAIISALFFRLSLYYVSQWEALISGSLFALHPIHVDAVTSVVGRAELLSALMFLLSHLYYCRKETKEPSVLVVFVLIFLGTLCKEQAVTGLITCLVHDLIFRWKSSGLIEKFKHNSYSRWKNAFTLCLGFLLITYFRIAIIIRSQLPSFSRLDNPLQTLDTPYYQLNLIYFWLINCWLLIYPMNLACDWSASSIQLITSIDDDLHNLFLICLSIIILVAFIHRSNSITLMATAMAIITYIPSSNLFFSVGFTIAERILYLPSMGFTLIVGHTSGRLFNYAHKQGWTKMWMTLILSVCIMLASDGLKTYNRCQVWRNEMTLFSHDLRIHPNNVKLLNNMGKIYESNGRINEAMELYRKVIRIQPDDVRGYLNQGKLLTKLSKFDEAESIYRQAMKLIPQISSSLHTRQSPFSSSTSSFSSPSSSPSASSTSSSTNLEKSLTSHHSIKKSSDQKQQQQQQQQFVEYTVENQVPIYEYPTKLSSNDVDQASSSIHGQSTSAHHHHYILSDETIYQMSSNSNHNTQPDSVDSIHHYHRDHHHHNIGQKVVEEEEEIEHVSSKHGKKDAKVTKMHLQTIINLASLISRDEHRFAEANSLFTDALVMRPDYSPTYHSWAQSIIQSNSSHTNEFWLSTSLASHDQQFNDPNILYNMAILNINTGNNKAALHLLDQALSLDPHHQECLLVSARLIKENIELNEHLSLAIKRLETVILIDKADHTVHFDLGMLFIRNGEIESAKSHLQKAIEMKPDFTEALFNMALLLYKNHEPLNAIPFLEFLLKTQESHGKALLLLLAINVSTANSMNQPNGISGQNMYSNLQTSQFLPTNVQTITSVT